MIDLIKHELFWSAPLSNINGATEIYKCFGKTVINFFSILSLEHFQGVNFTLMFFFNVIYLTLECTFLVFTVF